MGSIIAYGIDLDRKSATTTLNERFNDYPPRPRIGQIREQNFFQCTIEHCRCCRMRSEHDIPPQSCPYGLYKPTWILTEKE